MTRSQVGLPQGSLTNNKGDRSNKELNAWLDSFWSHGKKDTTKDGTELSRQGTTLPNQPRDTDPKYEPPDLHNIITAAQEYLASKITEDWGIQQGRTWEPGETVAGIGNRG